MEGEINVQAVMREAQRRLESRTRLRAVTDRIEEREALYWLHRAGTDGERDRVQELYKAALERYRKRKTLPNLPY